MKFQLSNWGPKFQNSLRVINCPYSPSPLRALVSSEYSNKHHHHHQLPPTFHIPPSSSKRTYSPSPLRALVSSSYSNKHHHHHQHTNQRLSRTPPMLQPGTGEDKRSPPANRRCLCMDKHYCEPCLDSLVQIYQRTRSVHMTAERTRHAVCGFDQ